MLKHFFGPFCLVLIAFTSLAQGEHNSLKCSGHIPHYFTRTSEEGISLKLRELDNDTNDYSKDKLKFLKGSAARGHLYIDNLLRSGSVMFNDELTTYIDKVADKVIVDKKLRNKLNFHTVRSGTPNAFVPDRELIFVNLALLAYLETEAQLAFVLAHEAAHYTERHVFRGSSKSYDVFSQSEKEYNSIDDALFDRALYSRQQETEADTVGLKMFMQSEYGTSSVSELMDILRHSYLPYKEVPFNKALLNTKHVKLPEELFFLEELNPIDTTISEEDSFSTHPATHSRKALLDTLIGKRKINGPNFLLGADEFYRIRNIARRELCRIYIQRLRYVDALHCANMILAENPSSVFAKAIVSKALFGTSLLLPFDTMDLFFGPAEDFEGEIHQTRHFIDKLSFNPRHFSVLALAKIDEFARQHPSERIFKIIREEMINITFFMLPTELENYVNAEPAAYKPPKRDRNRGRKMKKEEVEQERKNKEREKERFENHTVFSQALLTINEDSALVKYIDTVSEARKEYLDYWATYNGKKGTKKEQRSLRADRYDWRRQNLKDYMKDYRQGEYGEMERTIMLQPFFTRVSRKKRVRTYEHEALELADKIEELAVDAGMSIDMLTPYKLEHDEVERYNDLANIYTYFNSYNARGMYPVWTPDEVDDFVARNNTKYITAGRVFRQKQGVSFLSWISMVQFSSFFPVALPMAIAHKNRTVLLFKSYDITKDRVHFTYEREVRYPNRKFILDGQIYSMLVQMGRFPQPKKSKK